MSTSEDSPMNPSQEDAASVSETASVPVTSADGDIPMSDDNAVTWVSERKTERRGGRTSSSGMGVRRGGTSA